MSESQVVISRLSEAVGAKNDSDLARKLGTKPSTVSSWRTRNSVPYAECVNLSLKNGISLDWLLTGFGPSHRGTRELSLTEREDFTAIEEGLVPVPMYDVRAAAGDGAENDDNPAIIRIFRFPDWWLRRIGVEPKHAQVIVADGYSMRPEVEHGDLLVLDTDVQRNRRNGLFVFMLDGQVYIKDLQFLPGKTLRVVSRNKPAFQDYEIKLSKAASLGFELIARVAFHGSTL